MYQHLNISGDEWSLTHKSYLVRPHVKCKVPYALFVAVFARQMLERLRTTRARDGSEGIAPPLND